MLEVPRRWSDIDRAWMGAALARRFPGIVVLDVHVGEVEHGTNSRARVRLSLRGRGPSSVFVKGAGRRAHRVALLAAGALGTEARLADAGVRFPLEHPAFYGGGVDRLRAACVVVTEDLVAAGGTPNDGRTPLSVEAVRSGLHGLASLHAAYWGRPLPAQVGYLRPWRLGPALGAVSVVSLARGLSRADRVLGAPLHLPQGIGPRTLGEQFRRGAVLAASPPCTLLHGDPHPGNTYVTAEGRTGFFDWQLARLGHWSHDVGYFIVGSLAVADRRRSERELLSFYLDALGESGVRAPAFEPAWDRYRATPAFGLATWLHTLSFGNLQPVDVCTATIHRFLSAYRDLADARGDTSRS